MSTDTNIYLATAIILGTAAVTLTNYAFARDTSHSEQSAWDNKWVVQHDTLSAGGLAADQGGGETMHSRTFREDNSFMFANLGDASYARGDSASTYGGYTKTVRLDAKDPDANHNRGTRDRAKSELNQIIVYYNAAIRHDPNDDDAYFHRGIANFYAGTLAQANADLSKASELDPEYAYYALWIHIIDKRGNMASRLLQAISHVNMMKWPAPVIRLFLGQTTPVEVLAAAASPDAKTRMGQVCEATFYSGELALQQGAREDASRLFRLAAADCPREFVEGSAASAELNALYRNP
jgi:tetratricopeptide (TPR) repeat protein